MKARRVIPMLSVALFAVSVAACGGEVQTGARSEPSPTPTSSHPGEPLVGKHGQISCQQCHTQGISAQPNGCITCHGDQHNGLPKCVDCHKPSGWIPTTFRHPQEGPHAPRGDEPLQCNACHRNGFGQPPGCPCH